MRLILLPRALALLAMVLAFFPAWADPPKGYPFTDFDTALRHARADHKPIFLYFGRYGCAWCDHTNRVTFVNPDIRRIYSDNYELVYVDAEGGKRLTLPSGERITEADLGSRLGAFATPLFVYMTPEGHIVAKVPGFKTVQDFKDFDRYVRGGYYKTQTLAQFLEGGK
jgi:thioredoxin-related protein